MSKELTPVEIVSALDRHIVGQMEAKRAVAIAIRNRWRRRQLPGDMRDEVLPKNIILIGSTGVGKTEIARRVARLVNAPFIKVEATKYTEVGYHGRDVESMIRELVENSLNLLRSREIKNVEKRAAELAEQRLLDILIPPTGDSDDSSSADQREKTRESFLKKLRDGKLEDREIEIAVAGGDSNNLQALSNAGLEQFGIDLQSMMGSMGGGRMKQRRLTVKAARPILTQQEAEKLIDDDKIQHEAIEQAEQSGIIFLDEIDKVTSRGNKQQGSEVSREGRATRSTPHS